MDEFGDEYAEVEVRKSGMYMPIKATSAWATADGKGNNAAIAGEDYESRSGALEWEAGDTNLLRQTRIIDDGFDEVDEIFNIVLSNRVYV